MLCGRGDDEIEGMRELLVDDDRPGKQIALAIDLVADILADSCPPYIALGHQRRRVLYVVEFLLQAEPYGKTLHAH